MNGRPLSGNDLLAAVDRRTSHYQDALALAKAVLSGQGSALEEGNTAAWTYLMRTPETVEAGVRAVLADGLETPHSVVKKGRHLVGSTKWLNPDLLFDQGSAVGDVKYKRTGAGWNTIDLYQIVAFATGYRCDRAAIVGFSPSDEILPVLQVGNVRVTYVGWKALKDTPPEEAAASLVRDIADWLET